MIITRNIINKYMIFADYGNDDIPMYYSYDDVCKKVDIFKNYLISIGCKRGESVLIGYAPSIDQLGLFFAVCELGLNFIVNDYKTIDDEKFDFIDTKTKILSPINYFFDYGNFFEYKRDYFKKICDNYIEWADIEQFEDDSPNDVIWANSDDVLMKCTSSGTTGTPKKVTHTHKFLYNISDRNTMFFDGNVSLVYNFNHGSSLATYFIPALMSKNVKQFSNVYAELLNDFEKTESVFDDVDHLMIPYGNQLDEILNEYSFPKLNYYTLSSISEKWLNKDLKPKYNDIISYFGCNETSGPIFINRASSEKFNTALYYKIDDYYEIKSINPLTIYLKEYDIEINTKDIFEENESGFIFKGRNDLLRINGLPITEMYAKYLKRFKGEADFVYDTVYNKIYMPIWIKNDHKKVQGVLEEISIINDALIYGSDGKHSISKVDFLNRDDFVVGVKLDHEFLRTYFREKVEETDFGSLV